MAFVINMGVATATNKASDWGGDRNFTRFLLIALNITDMNNYNKNCYHLQLEIVSKKLSGKLAGIRLQ